MKKIYHQIGQKHNIKSLFMSNIPLLKHIVSFLATILILCGCGETSDSTSNATSDLENNANAAVSTSSQASDYSCRDGETIKNKKGTIISFCSEGEWNAVSQATQTEFPNKCQDGEKKSNSEANYICSNGQWISVVPTSQSNPISFSSSSQEAYSSSNEIPFIQSSSTTSSSSISRINSSSSNIPIIQSSSSKAKSSSSTQISWNYDTWCGWNNTFADYAAENSLDCAGYIDTYTHDPTDEFYDQSTINEKFCKAKSISLCGNYELNSGSKYNPSVVGIEIAIYPKINKAIEGVCISYTVDQSAQLEIGFGDEDEYYEYNLPYVTLPKATSVTTKKFKWSEFKQGLWSKTAPQITGTEASQKMEFLKFKIQGEYGDSGNFKIISIGPLNSGCRSE